MFRSSSPEEVTVNDLMQRLTRRAERLNPDEQIRTFVTLGGIEHSVLNAENRVISEDVVQAKHTCCLM